MATGKINQIDVTIKDLQLASEFLSRHRQLNQFRDELLKKGPENVTLSWDPERLVLPFHQLLTIINEQIYNNINHLYETTGFKLNLE